MFFLCIVINIICYVEFFGNFLLLSLVRNWKMLDLKNKGIISKYIVKKVNINCMYVYDF